MSDQWNFVRRRSRAETAGSSTVVSGLGTATAFLNHYRQDVETALKRGFSGTRHIAPRLFEHIADERTMRVAWERLARFGGQAPGPNRLRYSDLAPNEIWDLCRCLARLIAAGTYRPGPERVRRISKGPGRGTRPLILSNIEDRVVQRALVLILQPVIDRFFSPLSFGFRPKLGYIDALAHAEALIVDGGRPFAIAEDLADAYQHVPIPQLISVARTLFPNDALISLLERVLPSDNVTGIRQGSPSSPLLLNIYLHHFLDRPWLHDHPSWPLIRFADDLLLLFRTREEAVEAYDALRRLLEPTGMRLKGSPEKSIVDLREGVDWLGYSIRRTPSCVEYRILERSWDRLERKFNVANTKSNSPLRAIETVEGWLAQKGPCYDWVNRDEAVRRIGQIASDQGFEELPPIAELLEQWLDANKRWNELRQVARESLAPGHSQL